MQQISIVNGIIIFRGNEYVYESSEIIDSVSVHVKMSGVTFCFIIAETEINEKKFTDAESFLNQF